MPERLAYHLLSEASLPNKSASAEDIIKFIGEEASGPLMPIEADSIAAICRYYAGNTANGVAAPSMKRRLKY